ncbi:MAG: asparagine synthase-related protein, partial [Anaerolineales bacterium]
MSLYKVERIISSFFVLGFIKELAAPSFERKIDSLGVEINKFRVENFGYFFFTAPFYVDVAESGDMVWIKIGFTHDGEKLLTTGDLLKNGWLNFEGVEYDRFQGSVTLIGFKKHLPNCMISSNILSTSIINYFHQQESFLVTDNLRLMASLIQNPILNEEILPMHLLYRAVYGRSTYLKDVYKLTSGEVLTWKAGNLSVKLGRDIRSVQSKTSLLPVTVDSVAQFFDQFISLVGIYLNSFPGKSATMLSGGVDSTLIQAAINQQRTGLSEYPTLSYYLETECFDYEYEYAKQAAHILNTKHNFVRITPDVYRDYLIRCIEVLGHPPPDDVRPCFLMLTSNLPDNLREVDHYFHGIDAEIFGVQMSLEVVQGDK